MTQRDVLICREANKDAQCADWLTRRRRAEPTVHANQRDKSALDACRRIARIDDDHCAVLPFLIDDQHLVIVRGVKLDRKVAVPVRLGRREAPRFQPAFVHCQFRMILAVVFAFVQLFKGDTICDSNWW